MLTLAISAAALLAVAGQSGQPPDQGAEPETWSAPSMPTASSDAPAPETDQAPVVVTVTNGVVSSSLRLCSDIKVTEPPKPLPPTTLWMMKAERPLVIVHCRRSSDPICGGGIGVGIGGNTTAINHVSGGITTCGH